ncbi:transposase [Streptomyces sp. NPDC001410]|uniref:transposase n=1 Tax=Streptomyces sp. NPDC001410 TaxID=3364574 RepID=UPI0036BE2966
MITGTLDPHLARYPDDEWAQLAIAQLTGGPRHPRPALQIAPIADHLCRVRHPAASRRRRYPPDTSVAEWALLEPLLPVPAYQTKTGGHPEKWPLQEIVDGVRCIVDNGAKWRALPVGSPRGRRFAGSSDGGTGPGSSPTTVTSCGAGSVPARAAARTR